MYNLYMTNNKITHKNYNNNYNVYQLVLAIDTGFLIPENDSVRLLSQIMEELDYTLLMKAYSTKGRNPAAPPSILFKVLVYAYMNNIYSSRNIEKACKRDINFIWLLQGREAPNHNTIARFRTKRLADIIDDLFNQLVIKLGELGEIEYKNIFIDETKIEANANKYTFVWRKATNKFEVKLQDKVIKIVEEINSDFKTEFIIKPEIKLEVSYLKQIFKFLNEKKKRKT